MGDGKGHEEPSPLPLPTVGLEWTVVSVSFLRRVIFPFKRR